MAPLLNIKVLELGCVLAAPTAGQMLAGLGADVIKVDAVGTGDMMRSFDVGVIPDGEGRPLFWGRLGPAGHADARRAAAMGRLPTGERPMPKTRASTICS